MLLSVVIPVYNEIETIEKVIPEVLQVPVVREVIIVDDGSTDGTTDYLKSIEGSWENVRVVFHFRNRGKGAAIRTGFLHVTGDVIIIHDADSEYDPGDFVRIVEPILDNKAQVVYGSRFLGGYQASNLKYHVANVLLTRMTNVIFWRRITDVYTCYKCFTREVLESMHLYSNGFEIEAELTAKLLRGNWKIAEVPISYTPRKAEDGKKIKATDFFRGISSLVRYRFIKEVT